MIHSKTFDTSFGRVVDMMLSVSGLNMSSLILLCTGVEIPGTKWWHCQIYQSYHETQVRTKDGKMNKHARHLQTGLTDQEQNTGGGEASGPW